MQICRIRSNKEHHRDTGEDSGRKEVFVIETMRKKVKEEDMMMRSSQTRV